MRCPGCASFGGDGVVADSSGSPAACPLCTPYGTPGIYPGGGVGYGYQVNFSLTDQGAHSTTIQIRTSNDFLWQRAIATRTGTFNALILVNQVQIQTVYNQAGVIIPNAGVTDTNFWGTISNPFPLSSPIQLKANDFVTFTLTDTSGATGLAPNVIALYLDGANFDAGTFSQPTLSSTQSSSSSSGSGGGSQ